MQDQNIPLGLCQCGCGAKTHIAKRTSKAQGTVAGQPVRYLTGHHRRKSAVDYIIDPATGCWEWQLQKLENGYGLASAGKTTKKPAHRVYYERFVGPIPEKYDIHHLCRNRSCVNPAHLTPLSRTEHLRLNPNVKLSMAIAQEIRRLKGVMDGDTIARRYGISRDHVYSIWMGRKWKDE